MGRSPTKGANSSLSESLEEAAATLMQQGYEPFGASGGSGPDAILSFRREVKKFKITFKKMPE